MDYKLGQRVRVICRICTGREGVLELNTKGCQCKWRIRFDDGDSLPVFDVEIEPAPGTPEWDTYANLIAKD